MIGLSFIITSMLMQMIPIPLFFIVLNMVHSSQ